MIPMCGIIKGLAPLGPSLSPLSPPAAGPTHSVFESNKPTGGDNLLCRSGCHLAATRFMSMFRGIVVRWAYSAKIWLRRKPAYPPRNGTPPRAVSYSIKLGKEPNVFTVNDLSSKQAVNQARELKAGNIKFGIYASDGTLTELYDLERAVEGDDVANRT